MRNIMRYRNKQYRNDDVYNLYIVLVFYIILKRKMMRFIKKKKKMKK